MDIRTRNTEAYTAEAGNTRLDALNGALKSEDTAIRERFAENEKPAQAGQRLTRAGRSLTNRGKNAMNEAASQECDSEDAGEYATDRVTDKAEEAALWTEKKTKQGAEKTVDKVREEIRARRKERRQSRSAEGQFSGNAEYGRRFHGPEYAETGGNSASRGRSGQGGASRTERGGYRFSADAHNSGTGGRYAGTEGGDLSAPGTGSRFPGTEGCGVKADAPKENARFHIQEKPDISIRVRDSSVRSAERRIRTSAKQAGEAAKRAKKAAKAARKAAQRAAREAAKTAAKTTEKAAKATAKTAKAAGKALFRAVSAVIEKLAAACASGGPFVLIIILAAVYIGVIMCKIGDVADKLLSVFSLGGAIVWEGDVENLEEMIGDAHLEPNPAITALNESYHNRLDRIIKNNKHDEVILENPDPDWGDILGFWAAWQLCVNDGEFPDLESGMEGLPKVFADMVTVEFEVTEKGDGSNDGAGGFGYGSGFGVSDDYGGTDGSQHGESGNGGTVHTEGNKGDGDKAEPDEEKENEKLILTITVKQRSIEEMAELYELGEDGEDYIELMSEGSLFEVIKILTKYIEGYELPEEDTEEPEEGEESGGGRPGGGGSF